MTEFDLKEEKMRRAYWALLTGFIMTSCAPVADQNSSASTKNVRSQKEQSGEKSAKEGIKTEEVKYMVSQPGSGPTAPSSAAFSKYSAVYQGMNEESAANVVKDVVMESGIVYPANGPRRVYYRIGPNTQFWIELRDGLSPVVTRKSGLEPKQEWRRYPDGRVEVIPGTGVAGAISPDSIHINENGVMDRGTVPN